MHIDIYIDFYCNHLLQVLFAVPGEVSSVLLIRLTDHRLWTLFLFELPLTSLQWTRLGYTTDSPSEFGCLSCTSRHRTADGVNEAEKCLSARA